MRNKRRIVQRKRREPLYQPRHKSATWVELMKAVADVLYKHHDRKHDPLQTTWFFSKNEKMFVGVLANIILKLGERKYNK